MIRNLNFSTRRDKVAIVLGSLPLVWYFGTRIAQGSYAIPVSVAFGILAFVPVLHQPVIGLVLAWMVMVLIPYDLLRLPLPVLDSPLMIVAFLTLAVGLGRVVTRRQAIVPSNLYALMAAWAAVLIAFALIGHGPAATYRAQWTLQGTWSFVLVILVVKTPRQARAVVLVLVLSFVLLALIWLPGMLSSGGLSRTGSPREFGNYARNIWSRNVVRSGFGESLIGSFGTGGSITFRMIAMVWPILFSASLNASTRRLRWAAGLCSLVILASVLLSSYIVALIIIAAGTLFVLALTKSRSWRFWITAAILLGALSVLIMYTTGGQYMIQRLLSGNDPSYIGRQFAWQQGIRAFLARPLIGWGAYNRMHMTSSGHWLHGHSSFIPAAYEYGLAYLVPLAVLIFRLGRNLVRLSHKRLVADDRAALIGIQALFGTYIVLGFVNDTIGHIGSDSVFWLCMGLATVWLHWSKTKTWDTLVVWDS